MNVNEKITNLRISMKNNNLDAYIIPSSDPHMSEYIAEHWRARSWITGFTGSAGTFVATKNECCLWTDGRYFIQAEKQLAGSEVRLFKMGNPGVPTYIEWIAANLKQGEYVGFSGNTTSVYVFKDLESKFTAKGILINKSHDLIEGIWVNRPQIPAANIFSHDIKFAGLSSKEKIVKVRAEMEKAGAAHYLISSLDDIAWLFNIRGDDVPFISVAIAYAMVSMKEAFLFINKAKVPGDIEQTLNANGVEILDYLKVEERLKEIEEGQSIAFDIKRTNCRLYDFIPVGCKKVEVDEITTILKAVKNDVELKNYEHCQINDGVAMVRFLIWLEKNIGRQNITEMTVADKLMFFRKQQPDNLGSSFTTIAGYRDHAAMMHYTATEESQYTLANKGLMVLDSGGQYLSGTTDITRTIVFDDVSEEEKYDFTLVLKAHISLAAAKFLYGTTGSNLDVLARRPLWEVGLDYKCGTGHGVGYCLSVHEGPQSFSQIPNKIKLEKGMIITIEPGIYKEGKHGVRTENIFLVVEDEKTEYGQFLKFKAMSLCPICLKGISPEMLTVQEKTWLNNYHRMVLEILSPSMDSGEREWLKENTRCI